MTTLSTNSAIDLHIADTIAFVRSLVIKSVAAAKIVNQVVRAAHGPDSVHEEYPQTWKYFMNISGQYHFTDQMMKVISLDTYEEIDFTVQNLKKHTATADAYRHGTRYYYSLLRKYPQQEVLILSIVNPVDIHEAVSSPDGTILGWDPSYLEPQENTLIYDLQAYVFSFMSRYSTNGFYDTWAYYTTAQLFTLYFSLPAWVVVQRIQYCKTEKAHSFHIRNYLASHGRLDRYLPYLTHKQSLYLYMNIDRLEKNVGKTEIFEELIDWILTQRRVPLSSYTVRQLQAQNNELMPELLARRRSIGSVNNIAESEYVSLPVYYAKEAVTEVGNPRYFEVQEKEITHALQTSDSSVIQTKDLESAMVDYSDAVPDTLEDVLMRQWAYMSSHGLYNVVVNFLHPATGERYGIFAKDALIYFAYLYLSSNNITLDKLPEILNIKFRRHPRPPVALLYRDIPSKWPELYAVADELISNQPVLTECRSITQFFGMSYQIYEECMKHWRLKANIGDPMKRGVVAGMINHLYGIEGIYFNEDVTMQKWLEERSLPAYNGKRIDAEQIMKEIFKKATGYETDDTKSLRSIQKALLGLFSQLSSYSIQLMREINDSGIIPLNWAAIRIGVEGQEFDDEVKVKAPVRVQHVSQELYDNVDILIQPCNFNGSLITPELTYSLYGSVGINTDTVIELNASIGIPASVITDDSTTFNQQNPFHLMQYYNELTPEQIEMIGREAMTRN